MNKKYILFGAGAYARKAIELLGGKNIAYMIDNNPEKQGTKIEGIPVIGFADYFSKIGEYSVVIAVSKKYQHEIIKQIESFGMVNYRTIQEIQTEITREKLLNRPDYIEVYKKAIAWIYRNSVNGESIICNSDKPKGYPEVTGYYIPTLLQWGHHDLALSYAKWLCRIQKKDGSWYDTDDRAPYVFDTAQILKGLIAIREMYPQADFHIIKGCDWLIGNMQPSGRLTTPSKEAWGNGRACSELIHMYCLSPLVQAADNLGISRYKEAAYQILHYYKKNYYEEIMNFNLLSHFYAYVMEALLDMGERDMALEAMEKIGKLQNKNGAVPAYKDVNWVCSTGLFQFALVWFRLGNIERGNKAFEYACKLQNASGGWYGSNLSEENSTEENDYFPASEISWAVKYFLDALHYKNIVEFDLQSNSFLDRIDRQDGRYCIVRDEILSYGRLKKRLKVLDAGCGKGRYLKNLTVDNPENTYYAMDLSESVMKYITAEEIVKKQGSLTDIGYPDDFFDIVYTCEALEHAVDIESAIREMARVTKPGGKIIIIDKNKQELGRMEIGNWEVWFEAGELKGLLEKYCLSVQMIDKIAYEDKKDDKLFLAWIGTVAKDK